jgi:hypothetical protein
MKRKKAFYWFLAVLVTLASAVYQRMTGPTRPVRGRTMVAGTEIRFNLARSTENTRDFMVAVRVPRGDWAGHLSTKRFKTDDPVTDIPMERRGDSLVAALPRQPMAGKLAYEVFVGPGGEQVSLTSGAPVVIRFKGPVPAAVIILHVLVIFASMIFSAMAGIAALDRAMRPRSYAVAAAVLFFAGAFVLGPIVQKFAFGVAWAGFPLGSDLTDNKSLVSMIFWIMALIAGRKGKPARGWVLAASVVCLTINLIPHSLMGSEYKYR